jgi:hypothetical protein
MATASGFDHETQHRTRDAVRRLDNDISDLLRREPLVLGAVGLAIGAALGALLPETRFEKEHLGEQEDRLRKAGAEAASSAIRRAGAVATAAGHAAMEEADRQGFVTEEEAAQLSERIGTTADDALGKTDTRFGQ